MLNLDLHLRVSDRTSSVEELLVMLDHLEDRTFITVPDQNRKLLFTWLYVFNDRLDTVLDRRPPDIIDSFKLQFWHIQEILPVFQCLSTIGTSSKVIVNLSNDIFQLGNTFKDNWFTGG